MRADLPTGLVTFLLTDIEGSTRLLEQLGGAAYQRLLSDHDELLDKAVSAHAGATVDRVGDSWLVVFGSADDAVAAGLRIASSFRVHPWPADAEVRVRVGLHTGEALLEPERGYISLALHQASRVVDVAAGGQVLCTEAVVRASTGDFSRLFIGDYWLRDFATPVSLHRLAGDDRQPLNATRADTGTLPPRRGNLYGRDDAQATLASCLGESGATTIVGPGGVGKTRLALEHAYNEARAGVPTWFVALAGLPHAASTDEVLDHIAAELQCPTRDVDAVASKVLARRGLLVLDDAEAAIEAVGEVVSSLLAGRPDFRVLVTSQLPLGLGGERVMRLDPLALPDPDADVSTVGNSPAVALFCARARLAQAGFELSEGNRSAIVGLCTALAGLPLAISLAAARVGMLHPVDILERIEAVGELPARVGPDATLRQTTLKGVLDWSLSLCSPAQRRVLGIMSVFAGPTDVKAIAAVAGTSGGDLGDLTDAVAGLVYRSLAQQPGASHGTGRYDLLATVKATAFHQLLDEADRSAAMERHARWAATTADGARETDASAAEQNDLLRALRPELLLAAQRLLAGELADATIAEIADDLAPALMAGEPRLSERLISAALDGPTTPSQRAGLLRNRVAIATRLGDSTLPRLQQDAIDAARLTEDPRLIFDALSLSIGVASQGPDDAPIDKSALLEEMEQLLPQLTNAQRIFCECSLRNLQAMQAQSDGDPQGCRERTFQSLKLAREGAPRLLPTAAFMAAQFMAEEGDLESARTHFLEVVDASDAEENLLLLTYSHLMLAEVYAELGQDGAAADSGSQGVLAARRSRQPALLGQALSMQAQATWKRRDFALARSLVDEAVSHHAAIGNVPAELAALAQEVAEQVDLRIAR